MIVRVMSSLVVALLFAGAVKAGDYEDGVASYDRKDYERALFKFNRAAQRGEAPAQYNLGLIYYNGQGVAKDYTQAMRWYKLAAAQGYAAAQLNLGLMYDNGEGAKQDYYEAVRW